VAKRNTKKDKNNLDFMVKRSFTEIG